MAATAETITPKNTQQTFDPSQLSVSVRLLTKPQGKLIGLATVSCYGFQMEQFKVFNGSNGLFLGSPSVRDTRTNSFVKTIRITDEELMIALNKKAYEAYQTAVEKLAERAEGAKNMDVRPHEAKPTEAKVPYKEQYNTAAREAAAHNAAKLNLAKGVQVPNTERG